MYQNAAEIEGNQERGKTVADSNPLTKEIVHEIRSMDVRQGFSGESLPQYPPFVYSYPTSTRHAPYLNRIIGVDLPILHNIFKELEIRDQRAFDGPNPDLNKYNKAIFNVWLADKGWQVGGVGPYLIQAPVLPQWNPGGVWRMTTHVLMSAASKNILEFVEALCPANGPVTPMSIFYGKSVCFDLGASHSSGTRVTWWGSDPFPLSLAAMPTVLALRNKKQGGGQASLNPTFEVRVFDEISKFSSTEVQRGQGNCEGVRFTLSRQGVAYAYGLQVLLLKRLKAMDDKPLLYFEAMKRVNVFIDWWRSLPDGIARLALHLLLSDGKMDSTQKLTWDYLKDSLGPAIGRMGNDANPSKAREGNLGVAANLMGSLKNMPLELGALKKHYFNALKTVLPPANDEEADGLVALPLLPPNEEVARRPTEDACRPTEDACRPTEDADRPTENADRPTEDPGCVKTSKSNKMRAPISSPISCIISNQQASRHISSGSGVGPTPPLQSRLVDPFACLPAREEWMKRIRGLPGCFVEYLFHSGCIGSFSSGSNWEQMCAVNALCSLRQHGVLLTIAEAKAMVSPNIFTPRGVFALAQGLGDRILQSREPACEWPHKVARQCLGGSFYAEDARPANNFIEGILMAMVNIAGAGWVEREGSWGFATEDEQMAKRFCDAAGFHLLPLEGDFEALKGLGSTNPSSQQAKGKLRIEDLRSPMDATMLCLDLDALRSTADGLRLCELLKKALHDWLQIQRSYDRALLSPLQAGETRDGWHKQIARAENVVHERFQATNMVSWVWLHYVGVSESDWERIYWEIDYTEAMEM